MDRMFLRILKELGWPPIYLIPPEQYEQFEGEALSNVTWGYAAIYYPVITIHPDIGDKATENTIYHEIAHHLWPWRPHWWIDVFGEKMAGGGGRGWWAKSYNKTFDDLPPREKLVKMARRQAEKLKTRYILKRPNKRSYPEQWIPPEWMPD